MSDFSTPGEDGHALIRGLRESGAAAAIPVVAVTGYVTAAEGKRVLAAGLQVHVPKPIDPLALCAAVAGVLTNRST